MSAARTREGWTRDAAHPPVRDGRRPGRGGLRTRVLGACLLLAGSAAAQFVPVLDEDGFVRATSGRALVLPTDHGSHPETRIEWWYLTGALHGPDGEAFGFQATWFRHALIADVAPGRSPLAARDVMLFHGALTDVAAGSLSFHEQSCRAYPPWAHAATGALDVALLDGELRALDPQAQTAHLRCRAGDAVLELELDLVSCAPLLHGEEPGLSLKGPLPGQASWYYSLPRIAVTGTLQRDGSTLPVSGQAWFDHEFGSSQLSAAQVGWDWFSVALDDGSDLMLYRMRLADGRADAASAGTFREPGSGGSVPPRGRTAFLGSTDFAMHSSGSWRSPRSGALYPSGWTLSVPGEELELTVTPVVRDQELVTPTSTGVTYWEGLCSFAGTRAGRNVTGLGYVELVGYDRSFTDRL